MSTLRLFTLLAAFLCASCGHDPLSDIWDAFSADAFDSGMDDGMGDGDGGRPPMFEPLVTVRLDDAQGITGDVRNIALATLGAQTLAFLSAQTDGVHIVDVSVPSTINTTSVLGTLNAASLTAPAEIAGGRVDAVAVVDSIYLVCLAVGAGAVDANGNGVTVFHLPTVQTILLTPPPHDFSAALAPPTVLTGIAAPGDGNGNGGGVSGGNSSFLVATGGTELGTAFITQGTPGSWTAGPPLTSATPAVANWYHVLVNGTNAYTSVFADGSFGILAVSLLPMPAVATPNVIQIPGSIGTVNAGPGNFGMPLALEATTLNVGGDDEVRTFSVSVPVMPVPGASIPLAGENLTGLGNRPGILAVGAGETLNVFQTLGGFGANLAATLTFSAPVVVRGVAPVADPMGQFVLCCAGLRGLQVVQWSDVPG